MVSGFRLVVGSSFDLPLLVGGFGFSFLFAAVFMFLLSSAVFAPP